MLHLEFNPGRAALAHRQLMEQVHNDVASGAVESRQQLPTVHELARYWNLFSRALM